MTEELLNESKESLNKALNTELRVSQMAGFYCK